MDLEYLNNVKNDGDDIIRLYNFNTTEACNFYNLINSLLSNNIDIYLHYSLFINPINCKLTLKLFNEDIGIVEFKECQFHCLLSTDGYTQMLKLIEPFCKEINNNQYQWLYDLNNKIDFLFSPSGKW